MVKRGVDLAVAAALLLIFLPLMLLVAAIIRITSPGPALFRQERMGRGFKTFQIFKFRTMAHAQAGLRYTLGPDPRITRVGKWLRRSKIDELPQLLNVLRGEMSMVGPRPVIPELTEEFKLYYILLLRARPGLTDPASLKYSHEVKLMQMAQDPMRYFKNVVTPDKIRISLEYMERATLWTDLQTMGMTAAVCCIPRLSELYGKLPNARQHMPVLRPHPSPLFARAETAGVQGGTESLFTTEPVSAASTVDEVPRFEQLPWILLHNTGMQMQSTVVGAQERAS